MFAELQACAPFTADRTLIEGQRHSGSKSVPKPPLVWNLIPAVLYCRCHMAAKHLLQPVTALCPPLVHTVTQLHHRLLRTQTFIIFKLLLFLQFEGIWWLLPVVKDTWRFHCYLGFHCYYQPPAAWRLNAEVGFKPGIPSGTLRHPPYISGVWVLSM